MAAAFRNLPRVCPYLHLPFQSGSDRVLASMRRGYTRQQYLDTVAHLRDRVPELALSSDVIVGYPGETEAEFEETLRVLETVGFDGLFTFAYSPRPGTTALRLQDDVPEAEKRRRLHVERPPAVQRRRAGGLLGGRGGPGGERRRRGPCLGPDAPLPHRPLRRRGGSRRTVRQGGDHGSRAELPAGPSFASGSLTGSSAPPIFWPSREVVRRVEIEMAIKGLMVDPITNMPIIVLREVEGQRVLPIWVGVFEANAIALQVENVQTPRPMTGCSRP
jgi:hypothetical protein